MGATTTETVIPVPLGLPVPPFTPHAISVSLPTWRDNVGYEEGDKRVMDSMVCGYPRFFIGLGIQKLANICAQKFGAPGESAMLFPTQKTADACRSFIHDRSSLEGAPAHARLIQLLICPEDKANKAVLVNSEDCNCNGSASLLDLHIVLFPMEAFPLAKQFWQHCGAGISSRLAEQCLSLLPEGSPSITSSPPPPFARRIPFKTSNRHYSVKETRRVSPPTAVEDLNADHSVYLEERYGRNLPITAAAAAKRALRRRISGVLLRDDRSSDNAGDQNLQLGPSARGVSEVSETDVYLYPGGMNAIWNAHQLALGTRPPAKSVCFGFPYIDTLKVLQKWGPGCHFLGHGLDSDIDELENILEEESKLDPSKPPILALFTEPTTSPKLADKYDFLIVVDETVGNFMNVEVLPFADMVVSSLTKVFSGSSNVMGGSLVLNPKRRHYASLKSYLELNYEDIYFDEDAIFMERNSRDVQRRIKVIDHNTETISASHAFFDALPCHKGPSLGTNFTLASPFTILAHFTELDWAAQYGVEADLDTDVLLAGFDLALKAAKAAHETS
ncbi:PLP-dependent transferase [Gymnopus androsaceus JB14]|uniref:PLP-dependent transferase n=1 Tax=Gymnopus androsaceus JB14 TaxID=1447944 RepID=A0A6A4IDF1_9AGAR|nr:PLP-dependent transferase [Gymnopus androsaceus JB14]